MAARASPGPLFIGRDTHALSEPAQNSALEVLAANGVTVLVDARHGYTPTPALSHAILKYNREAAPGTPQADGIVVTPSHNPPGDGGFKYNPPTVAPPTRCHRMDRRPRQPAPRKRPPWRQADPVERCPGR